MKRCKDGGEQRPNLIANISEVAAVLATLTPRYTPPGGGYAARGRYPAGQKRRPLRNLSRRLQPRPIYVAEATSAITGSLVGSVWGGKQSNGGYYDIISSRAERLHYKTPSGFFKEDAWSQDGDNVTMEFTNKFATFGCHPRFANDGHRFNKDNFKWTGKRIGNPPGSTSSRWRTFAPIQARSLVGTTQGGKQSNGNYYEYHFQPGGVLHYKTPNGSYKGDSWRQDGNKITMEFTNKFRHVYRCD